MADQNGIEEIQRAQSIEFAEGPGVRLTDNIFSVHTLSGKTAPPQLLDDVFNTLREKGGEALLSQSISLDFKGIVHAAFVLRVRR
jgi:hypothetical protein